MKDLSHIPAMINKFGKFDCSEDYLKSMAGTSSNKVLINKISLLSIANNFKYSFYRVENGMIYTFKKK